MSTLANTLSGIAKAGISEPDGKTTDTATTARWEALRATLVSELEDAARLLREGLAARAPQGEEAAPRPPPFSVEPAAAAPAAEQRVAQHAAMPVLVAWVRSGGSAGAAAVRALTERLSRSTEAEREAAGAAGAAEALVHALHLGERGAVEPLALLCAGSTGRSARALALGARTALRVAGAPSGLAAQLESQAAMQPVHPRAVALRYVAAFVLVSTANAIANACSWDTAARVSTVFLIAITCVGLLHVSRLWRDEAVNAAYAALPEGP